MRRHSALWATCIGAFLTVLAIGPSAEVQYFGPNNVHYEDLAFEVLATEHCDVYFYPGERNATADVTRMAERWNVPLSTLRRHSLSHRQPIVLYASQPDFQQTNVITGVIHFFNFAIAEIYLAHPFQRPGRRLVWAFSLTPGF